MGSTLDISLRKTAQTSFYDFFAALQGDGSGIYSFLDKWSTFHQTIRTQRDKLQHETLHAAHSLASMVDVVISDIINLEKSTQSLFQESDMLKMIEDGLRSLSISAQGTSMNPNEVVRLPAYIKPSYEWLLSNLHNPYPSKELKKTLSNQSKCSVKDIDAWFIDVRKRIGWNKLRKTRFGNKQEKIIAAATHVFKPSSSSFKSDLNSSLISEMEPHDTHRGDFIAMQGTARRLYAGRFPELASSSLHSRWLEDSMANEPLKNTQKNDVHSETQVSVPQSGYATFPYPTPEPSPSRVPSESPQLQDISLPTTQASPNSRKRRQSSFSNGESDDDCPDNRPSKRSRSDSHPTVASSASSSPSSAFSSPSLTNLTLRNSPPQHNSTVSSVSIGPSTLKRKRRLSDGESHNPPKRPHNALACPRLQTVSDPLPITKSRDFFEKYSAGASVVEDDFSDTIPVPVNLDDSISSTTALDVNFHLYDISSCNSEVFFPGIFTNVGRDHYAPVSSPDSTASSVTESLSFVDFFQDVGLSFIDSLDLPFNLSATPSYHSVFPGDLSIGPNHTALSPNSGISPNNPGYIPDSLSLLNDAYSSLKSLNTASTNYLKPLNSEAPSGIHIIEEQELKRARVQALRQELAIYEAEGL